MRASKMVVGYDYRIKHWQGPKARLVRKASGKGRHVFLTPEGHTIELHSHAVLGAWSAVDEAQRAMLSPIGQTHREAMEARQARAKGE